jgi:hypothetical protein
MSFFQMKKYHYNIFNSNKQRYTKKTNNLGYISKEDIDKIYNESLDNNIRSSISKFVLNPFEFTFSTDFLLDYNNIKNYKDTYDINIKNIDELTELYLMIYREFEKYTDDKYNIHIVFKDEYERIFDYIFDEDKYNNRAKSCNSKKNIDIIVNVNNYHYEELENYNEDDEEDDENEEEDD